MITSFLFSGAELSQRELRCQVSEKPMKTKIKVTGKPLVIYCDSISKQFNQRRY